MESRQSSVSFFREPQIFLIGRLTQNMNGATHGSRQSILRRLTTLCSSRLFKEEKGMYRWGDDCAHVRRSCQSNSNELHSMMGMINRSSSSKWQRNALRGHCQRRRSLEDRRDPAQRTQQDILGTLQSTMSTQKKKTEDESAVEVSIDQMACLVGPIENKRLY